MCLFFDDLEECDHAECVIVNTIKSLNRKVLYAQGDLQEARKENLNENLSYQPSISHMMSVEKFGSRIKMEEQEDERVPREIQMRSGEGRHEDLRNRIAELEREVSSLRSLIIWMRDQLEKKGILQL